jgi:hypothetical protein
MVLPGKWSLTVPQKVHTKRLQQGHRISFDAKEVRYVQGLGER